MQAYQAALSGDAGLADCHYNLALLYEKLGKPKEAIRHSAVSHAGRGPIAVGERQTMSDQIGSHFILRPRLTLICVDVTELLE